MSIVGTRVVRTEDQNLITEGGTYVDDLRLEALSGAAYAAFVRSPIALAGETLLFDGTDSNVVQVSGAAAFDDSIFDGCDAVVTQTVINQRLAPAPLEVRGAACAWGEDGRLTIWLSTQNAQMARGQIAMGLGVGEETIRVV